jgi:NAD(P)H-quinone oxidoreductase subunit 5
MMDTLTVSGLAVVTAPASLLGVLGVTGLAGRPLGERTVGAAMRLALGVAGVALLAIAAAELHGSGRPILVDGGTWFSAPGYRFEVRLLFDRLSIAFAALTIGLGGAVGVFAERYLHREPGYHRFFLLLALFISGLLLTTLAATIELVYAGWELVGLSSALLIAFFHERPEPVRNGLRAFVVYRGCDAGLLAAAVLVHHWTGTGDLTVVLGAGSWPGGAASLSGAQVTLVAAAVLIAAMGKSAQVPLSGWLPRAMEGPTPSSCIFYGALSVHAGAYLLLRIGPLLDRAPVVAALVVVVGLATALHATLVARVQTDIKCALAYASLTQVGIIFVEIGFGLRLLALAHIAGHACLRSLQFLRTPSLLHDFHQVENAVGGHLVRAGIHLERAIPGTLQRRWYVWALERGGLDAWLDAFVVRPFVRTAGAFDRLERRWTARLGRSEDTGSAP